jgi:MoaE-MoaD fusion protein
LRTQVLFFAQAREQAGRSQAPLELPDGSRVTDALDAVVAAHPGLAALRPHLAVAVNGALARMDERVPEGAEIALLPPVSGG